MITLAIIIGVFTAVLLGVQKYRYRIGGTMHRAYRADIAEAVARETEAK